MIDSDSDTIGTKGKQRQEDVMNFLIGFISYAVKFIIFGAVAIGGVMLGKSLREKKNAAK